MSLMRQYGRYRRPDFSDYRRFVADGRAIGWVRPDLARAAAAHHSAFRFAEDRLTLLPATIEARSLAMAELLADWAKSGRVPGWRNELYPVNGAYGEAPVFFMERAATPLFGILAYGVNLNGFLGQGWETRVWIARRAAGKAVDPGLLDVMVGGGLPAGLSPMACLVKECAEEAGIDRDLALAAHPVGVTSLAIEAPEGLRLGLQFNFDLELPADFRPRNQDGEVAEFLCLSAGELLYRLRNSEDFMFDAALAKLDFLIRHGLIGPEEPDYLALLAGLRPMVLARP